MQVEARSLKCHHSCMIDEETSKRITSLRFLLACFVVFIHNNYTVEKITESIENGAKEIVFNQSFLGNWIQIFISSAISCCAVPLFFLFAAYLQAKKNDAYPTLLKKRLRTLFLPYCIWVGIYLLYFTIGKIIISKIAPSVLANPEKTVLTWTPSDWFHAIIGFQNTSDGNPIVAGQFWFVRDLIIFTLLSPIFIRLIKKFPTGFFAFSLLFYILGKISFDAHLPSAVFYYVCGLYWGIFDITLLKRLDKISWIEAFGLFLFSFVSNFVFKMPFMSALHTFVACCVILKLSNTIICSNRIFGIARKLSGYSFFLYAIHMPVVIYVVQKIWLRIFPMKNAFFCLFEYFGATILIIAVGTGIGIALKKICPPLFALLNGGRK